MKLASIALLMATMVFAQRGPGHAGAAFRGRYVAPPPVAHPAHAAGAVIVPYPVFYYGGYYGYDPSVPAGAQSAPAYDASQYAYGYQNGSQSPVVVINQGFVPDGASPSLQDYSNVPLPESTIHNYDGGGPPIVRDPQPTIYLIAMTDHSIVAAIGYWVQGDTLNYITQDGNQNRVSMALVDRDFSKQLNDERHVEFHLPAQNSPQ
jgi:hypothetical protein